jgi:hypothetical protein
LVEQGSPKPQVVGSNPTWRAKYTQVAELVSADWSYGCKRLKSRPRNFKRVKGFMWFESHLVYIYRVVSPHADNVLKE